MPFVDSSPPTQDASQTRSTSQARAWRRLRRSGSAWLGGALVGWFVFLALAADLLSPYQPDERHRVAAEPSARYAKFSPPSARFWLGTDENAKDVLTRVMHGSRLSLIAGGLSVLLAVLIGAPLGLAAGYFGKAVDALLMRTVDVALAF